MSSEDASSPPPELAEAIQRLVAMGAIAEAKQKLEEWRQLFGEIRRYHTLAFLIQQAEGDVAAMTLTAEQAIRRWHFIPEVHRMAIKAALMAQDDDRVAALSRVAVESFPDDIELLEFLFKTLSEVAHQDAVSVAERLVLLGHEPGTYLARIGVIKLAGMEGAEALRYFRAAIASGADETSLLVELARSATMARQWPAAREYWQSVLKKPDHFPPRTAEKAQAELARIAQLVERDIRQRDIAVRDAAQLMSGKERSTKPYMFRTPREDMIGIRAPGSAVAIIEFGVITTMMGIARPVLTPKHEALGVNMIMFSDPRRMMMMGGAVSLGADYPETIVALRRLLDSWGVERLYVAGKSGGSYPAICYGLDLGARRIFLHAPGVVPAEETALSTRLRQALGPRATDIRQIIRDHRGASAIAVSYDVNSPADVVQAEYLRDLPNVRMMPYEGQGDHSKAVFKGRSGYKYLLAKE